MRQILIEKHIKPSEIIINENYIIERWFDRNGDLHSFMGQPAFVGYKNVQISYQGWYKKGKCHRDGDQPAYISYDSNGQIDYQEWYKKGDIHRDGDLPADIGYDSNGQIYYQEWCKKGVRHRDGALPAYIGYDSFGQIIHKTWYKKGEFIK
jgi:antitoxin component YwqK of YwqJK toxin-antitoxin module